MTTNILSDKWRGQRAELLDPASLRFTAERANLVDCCDGCLFAGQGGATCMQAAHIAMAAGLPDCEDRHPVGGSYVYVIDKSDARQLPLLAADMTMGHQGVPA